MEDMLRSRIEQYDDIQTIAAKSRDLLSEAETVNSIGMAIDIAKTLLALVDALAEGYSGLRKVVEEQNGELEGNGG